MKAMFFSAAVVKKFLIAAFLVVCLTQPLLADTIFSLNGTFADSSTVSGTLTIDTVAGLVNAANLVYSGDGQTYNQIFKQGPFTGNPPIPNGVVADYQLSISQTLPPTLPIIGFGLVGTSSVGSLIGYTGGIICSLDVPCGPTSDGTTWFSSYESSTQQIIGLKSGFVSPVPEPSSMLLLGSGLLGLMGMGLCKKRLA